MELVQMDLVINIITNILKKIPPIIFPPGSGFRRENESGSGSTTLPPPMVILYIRVTKPHLLKILKGLVLTLHDGGHPAQGGLLQLLAPVQAVPELEEPHVVLGHVVDQVAGRVDLTQSQLVMILHTKENI